MITSVENSDFESLKKDLNRALWRLQYKCRKLTNTEIFCLDDNYCSDSFESKAVSKLDLEDIIKKIPSEKSKYIIIRTILQGATEKEVAIELKISQQAVSKCKTKTLKNLQMKISA